MIAPPIACRSPERRPSWRAEAFAAAAREVARVRRMMAAAPGLSSMKAQAGEYLSGRPAGAANLASVRFAMIDDGVWPPPPSPRPTDRRRDRLGLPVGGIGEGLAGAVRSHFKGGDRLHERFAPVRLLPRASAWAGASPDGLSVLAQPRVCRNDADAISKALAPARGACLMLIEELESVRAATASATRARHSSAASTAGFMVGHRCATSASIENRQRWPDSS